MYFNKKFIINAAISIFNFIRNRKLNIFFLFSVIAINIILASSVSVDAGHYLPTLTSASSSFCRDRWHGDTLRLSPAITPSAAPAVRRPTGEHPVPPPPRAVAATCCRRRACALDADATRIEKRP